MAMIGLQKTAQSDQALCPLTDLFSLFGHTGLIKSLTGVLSGARLFAIHPAMFIHLSFVVLALTEPGNSS